MDTGTPIPVSINPTGGNISSDNRRAVSISEYSLKDKMSQRMREFEDECRQWRDRFFTNDSKIGRASMGTMDRPRMSLDFPEFPSRDFGQPDWWATSSLSGGGGGHAAGSSSAYKTFIEENVDGSKRYKIQFDTNDFKPGELSLKTDGRMLSVKGEKRLVQGNATETRQFNRELTLPEFVDSRYVSSFQQPDGSLIVEAPVLMDKYRSLSSFNQQYSTDRSKWLSDGSRSADFQSSASVQTQPSSGYISSIKPTVSNTFVESARSASQQQQRSFSFDLREYRPENISIKLDDNNVMTIHAIRTDRDNSGKTHREFKREIELPMAIDNSAIRSCFSSDGTLTIDVPEASSSSSSNRAGIRPTTLSTMRPTVSTTSSHNNNNAEIVTTDSSVARNEPLKLTYDLKGYLPTEVTVRVNDNVLDIKAKKNTESALRTGSTYQHPSTSSETSHQSRDSASSEYVRKYRLPNWVNVDELKAHLDSEGILSIEVPSRR